MKLFIIMMASITVIACSNDSDYRTVFLNHSPAQVPVNSLVLTKPKSCPDLKKYLVESKIKSVTQLPISVTCGTPALYTSTGTVDSIEKFPNPVEVSDTNNQIAGVSEADIIKTDDSGILYIASGKYLIIANGFPAQNLNILKKINTGGQVGNIFLDKVNQRVVVLSRYNYVTIIEGLEDNTPVSDNIIASEKYSDTTNVIFIDVKTPSNPIILKQLRFDGLVLDGRRIDNRIHLILSKFPEYNLWRSRGDFYKAVESAVCENNETDPATILKHPEVVKIKAAILNRITKTHESISINDLLPKAKQSDGLGGLTDIPYLACSDILHPKIHSGLIISSITSIDTNGQNVNATAISSQLAQTYVNKNTLYLTDNNYSWAWTSQDGSSAASQTALHKFAIVNQNPVYTATGTVDGHSQNQFSLSEYNGDLRLATTQNDIFRVPKSKSKWEITTTRVRTNNLFVLRENGKNTLDVIGQVRNFGENETIQSSRFIQNRAYIVTFRQTDPLFTFDLSIPETPILKGELTLPGFSRYIQAFDKDHLITIGRSGNFKLQLQLFNVADLSKPKLLHAFVPNSQQLWSISLAEYDHKAFTFYKPANLLSIPLQYSDSATNNVFSGIHLFNVSIKNGFTASGTIDHSDLAYDKYCDPAASKRTYYDYDCLKGNYNRWSTPRRTVVMTTNSDLFIYTLSDVGLKSTSILDAATTLGSIVFPTNAYP